MNINGEQSSKYRCCVEEVKKVLIRTNWWALTGQERSYGEAWQQQSNRRWMRVKMLATARTDKRRQSEGGRWNKDCHVKSSSPRVCMCLQERASRVISQDIADDGISEKRNRQTTADAKEWRCINNFDETGIVVASSLQATPAPGSVWDELVISARQKECCLTGHPGRPIQMTHPSSVSLIGIFPSKCQYQLRISTSPFDASGKGKLSMEGEEQKRWC